MGLHDYERPLYLFIGLRNIDFGYISLTYTTGEIQHEKDIRFFSTSIRKLPSPSSNHAKQEFPFVLTQNDNFKCLSGIGNRVLVGPTNGRQRQKENRA